MISAFILPINAELKYVDAFRLTLIGKVMPTPENVYHRVDTVKYNDMPFQVKRLFTHSAGLVVSFKTNSPTVAARWTTKGKGVMGNVTPICDRGLDLYMNDGGKWIPVGAGTPSAGKAEQERVITKNLKPGVHISPVVRRGTFVGNRSRRGVFYRGRAVSVPSYGSYVWIEYLAWGLCQSFGAGVPCANVEKYGYQFRELRFERKR